MKLNINENSLKSFKTIPDNNNHTLFIMRNRYPFKLKNHFEKSKIKKPKTNLSNIETKKSNDCRSKKFNKSNNNLKKSFHIKLPSFDEKISRHRCRNKNISTSFSKNHNGITKIENQHQKIRVF